jgi:hypothetical protein
VIYTVYTAQEFNNLIDSFIDHCEESNSIPDDYNLIKFSGNKLSSRTLDRYFGYMDNTEDNTDKVDKRDKTGKTEKIKYSDFGDAIKKLIMYREHYMTQLSIDNPKTIGRTNFASKQGRWGAWTDKQEINQDVKIQLQINGQSPDLLG